MTPSQDETRRSILLLLTFLNVPPIATPEYVLCASTVASFNVITENLDASCGSAHVYGELSKVLTVAGVTGLGVGDGVGLGVGDGDGLGVGFGVVT